MLWNLARGFLPDSDPVEILAVKSEKYHTLVNLVEGLAMNLIPLLHDQTAREELVCTLREVVPLFDHDLFNSFGSDTMDERGFFVYGYFAAAYVNSNKPLYRLAKEITIPIVRLAERAQRKPVLDYYSYIMYNWRRKNPTGPLTVDNLEPLLTFSGLEEEKQYIISRVAVEALAQPLMKLPTLDLVSKQLTKMIGILEATPALPREVETYFQSFVKVTYEGWGWPDPQTYNGEVATQSTLLSLVARLLGIKYDDSDIRDYKPIPHRHFLDSVKSLRDTSETYNGCINKFTKVSELLTSPQSNSMYNRLGVA